MLITFDTEEKDTITIDHTHFYIAQNKCHYYIVTQFTKIWTVSEDCVARIIKEIENYEDLKLQKDAAIVSIEMWLRNQEI